MEPSPLTQQARPDVFQPKIAQLYEAFFNEDDAEERSEGFWKEFFLLKPDPASLRRVLESLSPDDLLSISTQTQELFSRSVNHVTAGQAPTDVHALDTLTTFLNSVLSHKFTNPSSDVINVLAGLDHVDAVFMNFVSSLDIIIRSGRNLDVRQKAIEVAISLASGAYQTSLLSYFTHRDLFPSLMKFVQESDTPLRAYWPFTLLGLLANYNKFEFQNPYRVRLEDFVNEAVIQKLVVSIGDACAHMRDEYVAIQDDIPEGWSVASTLGMFGLGRVVGAKPTKKPTIDTDTAKQMFAKLPGNEAAILLAVYDFAHANKLFCFNLVSLAGEKSSTEPPIASFMSLTSYTLQHAYLSHRAAEYARLNLTIIRLLIEDQVLCKKICTDESKVAVRLCRQRSPYLPAISNARPLAASILDTMVDGVNHNLRKRLDIGLYNLFVGNMLRLISHLSRSRTRLPYHWSELFRSLLTLVRFLATYSSDLSGLLGIEELVDGVTNLLALCLSTGEYFLPTPAAYDDLFYKLVETGDILTKFSEAWNLSKRPSSSISTLISVSTHYKELLKDGLKGGAVKHLTSAQVTQVIKQGYETLSIQAKEGLDSWTRYREVEERSWLKKVARTAVADSRAWISANPGT